MRDVFDPKKPRVLAIDCEATSLHGPVFAVGAVLLGEDWRKPLATIGLRCPPQRGPSTWVNENVVPKIEHLTEAPSAQGMMDAFWEFFAKNREGAIIVADVPWPVETRFLSDVINNKGEIMYDEGRGKLAPYPLYDLATILASLGIDPDVDREKYLTEDFFTLGLGGKHNPVYDAAVTAVVSLRILMERPRWNPLMATE